MLEDHVVRIGLVQFTVVADKEFQYQGLVIITVVRGYDDLLCGCVGRSVVLVDSADLS